MKTITSRQNPMVRAFRELADHPDPSGTRLLLDGAHLVRDAAAAGVDFELVCVATSKLEHDDEEGLLARTLAQRGIEVLTVPDQVLAAMSPVRTPSGIVAVGRRQPATPTDVCGHPSPFVLVTIDVQNPGNVGAALRVAEASGATGAFVAGTSADPFSWKALRGSMGSALRLPVVTGLSVPDIHSCLRRHGIRTVAAVARGGSDPDSIRWDGGVAILVGGEGPGLGEDIVRACDERVTIPMGPPVDSLNVAVAAAVLLYAARRQRLLPG